MALLGFVKRVADSRWLSRYGNVRTLAGFLALLLGAIGLGVGAVLKFPLVAQVLLAVGAAGAVLAGAPMLARRVVAGQDLPLRQACQDLLTELATMRGRVKRVYDDRRVPHNFFLPAEQFAEHRDTLTERKLDELHDRLREIYTDADHVNVLAQQHYVLPEPVTPEEYTLLGALFGRIQAAEHDLRTVLARKR
jgi:hypothetical protein